MGVDAEYRRVVVRGAGQQQDAGAGAEHSASLPIFRVLLRGNPKCAESEKDAARRSDMCLDLPAFSPTGKALVVSSLAGIALVRRGSS